MLCIVVCDCYFGRVPVSLEDLHHHTSSTRNLFCTGNKNNNNNNNNWWFFCCCCLSLLLDVTSCVRCVVTVNSLWRCCCLPLLMCAEGGEQDFLAFDHATEREGKGHLHGSIHTVHLGQLKLTEEMRLWKQQSSRVTRRKKVYFRAFLNTNKKKQHDHHALVWGFCFVVCCVKWRSNVTKRNETKRKRKKILHSLIVHGALLQPHFSFLILRMHTLRIGTNNNKLGIGERTACHLQLTLPVLIS